MRAGSSLLARAAIQATRFDRHSSRMFIHTLRSYPVAPPAVFTTTKRFITATTTISSSTMADAKAMSASPALPAASSFTPDSCRRSAFRELDPFILPDSATTLSRLLSINHSSHHCFFNNLGMHNHLLHQLVACLTLSATPAQLERHFSYQRSHYIGAFRYNDRERYDPLVADTSGSGKGGSAIEAITEVNWKHHLGDARYYWSYLHFFDRKVAELGFPRILEEYVFSREANEDGVGMIVRFTGGVLHAAIHVGYGLELGVGGIVAEGLAMAAVTAASHGWLFDYKWLTAAPRAENPRGLLQLLREVQQDERLSVTALKLRGEESSLPDKPFEQGSGKGVIQSYVDRWAIRNDSDIEAAMADLALVSALLLGAVPKQNDGIAYKHDFFLMHLNNAHLFTPLYLSLLPPSLATIYLRALLAQLLYYYVSRGRPAFHFHRLPCLSWEEMFSTARDNVDEHLPKAVRALYVFERRYLHAEPKLLDSGLVERWEGEDSVWKNTATQLVRMHRGELQPSKYVEQRDKREEIGAHQEFWSFQPFF